MVLGLSESEVEVYFQIVTNGPIFARNIINSLPINERVIYGILRNLQMKGIILAIGNKPKEYLAIPFEEVLSMLIEQKEEQAREFKERREELVHNWEEHGN
jgi:sugar-specific transcriptional regulator TrmB